MKKIFLILSLFSTIVLINSCRDAYEIVQGGEFSEAATFRTVDDMQLYLNEVYDQVNTAGEIELSSILTDEVGIGSQNGGQDIVLYKFILNPSSSANSNSVSTIWMSHYRAINYANRLLRGAERISPASADLAKYNSILAQARAIRAFAHFQLLTYFSTDLKNDNALGVIKMDKVPSTGEKLARNTNGEVFKLIEDDLDFAETNLGTPAGALPAYKYVSQNMINALKARMYLYRGNYAKAEFYADKVISTSGRTLTVSTPIPGGTAGTVAWQQSLNSTSSTNPYRRMWADIDQGEVLFALDRSVGKSSISSIFYFNATNLTGGPYLDMGRNLFNILNSTTGDIRRFVYTDYTSKVDQNYLTSANYKLDDVLCIDKYPGKVSGAPLNNDLKVFRLSEMYLIKAECRINANDLPGAANLIKAIRDARNYIGATTLPVYPTAKDAWADVLKERRVELCFEGHRYIDLKRLGVLAGAQVDRHPRDVENLPEATMAPNDHRFTLPIPFDEINGNPNMVQNPGY